MKHDFIDKYSTLESPVHRLDPRVKIISVFSGIVIIVSDPYIGIRHFVLYIGLIALITLLSRVPFKYILKRCLLVSPFIVLAALFLPLSGILTEGYDPVLLQYTGLQPALAILFKAYPAVILLTLLASTEKFNRLLLGMRTLKAPRLLGILSAIMYRYIFVLTDEALKTTRARQSRTPGKLRMSLFTVYGNQMAVIFLRSWERSRLIYSSMLSRGFSGEFPDMQRLQMTKKDILYPAVFITILMTIRLWNL